MGCGMHYGSEGKVADSKVWLWFQVPLCHIHYVGLFPDQHRRVLAQFKVQLVAARVYCVDTGSPVL